MKQDNKVVGGFDGVQATPFHYHNGIDAPRIPQSSVIGGKVYAGQVNSAGAAIFLPPGWSCGGSGGNYTVTHHLNTTKYAVSAIKIGASGSISIFPSFDANSFGISESGTASSFMFILATNS